MIVEAYSINHTSDYQYHRINYVSDIEEYKHYNHDSLSHINDY